MTPSQLTALKAAILAETNAEFIELRNSGATGAMAEWLNGIRDPALWIKRTSLSRHEILTATSEDGTTFAWAGGAYITRNQGERDAFREMFNSTGTVNPSLPSIQAAFGDIFSGIGGAGNRAHITAMSRRKATRAEAVFAVGAGTPAAPATAEFEGSVSNDDVVQALALP